MANLFNEIGWVDWLLLAVVLASVLVGLVRGFIFECLSLAGWVVAWFAAQWSAPWLAPRIPVGSSGGGLNLSVAFAAAFVLALLIWTLLARLARLLIQSTPLSLPDRLLGAAFGALRAGVLLLALTTVVMLTPAAQSAAWRASTGARVLAQALAALKPLLPEPAARLLPA